MSWQQLEIEGKVRKHQTSKGEIDDFRAVRDRDLQDAAITQLSDDRRFATAYNAALETAKMVIACSGFRVIGLGHHQTTFEAVKIAMGNSVNSYSIFFDSCRRKRNRIDYDMSGIASRTEVDELMREAEAFSEVVEKWISTTHPSLTA